VGVPDLDLELAGVWVAEGDGLAAGVADDHAGRVLVVVDRLALEGQGGGGGGWRRGHGGGWGESGGETGTCYKGMSQTQE
jgi:hypothetical protein